LVGKGRCFSQTARPSLLSAFSILFVYGSQSALWRVRLGRKLRAQKWVNYP